MILGDDSCCLGHLDLCDDEEIGCSEDNQSDAGKLAGSGPSMHCILYLIPHFFALVCQWSETP